MSSFLQYIDPARKKQLILAAIGIGLLILSAIAYYLISHGGLVVKTNASTNSISVSQGSVIVGSAENVDSLSLTLPVGDYTVTVKNRDGSNNLKRQVSVKSLQTTTIDANLPANPQPEPVTNMPMLYPHFSEKGIVFYSTSLNKIGVIDRSSSLRFLPDNIQDMQTAAWANDGTGYFVLHHSENDPWTIARYSDGALKDLVAGTDDFALSMAVNEAGRVYVINNNTLFESDDRGNTLKKMVGVPVGARLQAAHGNKVVLLKPGKGIVNNQPDFSYGIAVMDTSGRVLGETQKTVAESADSAGSIQWSPDGQRLVFTDGFQAVIYNDSLQEVGKLPDGLARSVTWESNESIIYAGNNSVWRYNIADKTSSSITSVLKAYKVYTSFSPLPDGSLYFSAGSNRYVSWYRVNTKQAKTANPTADILGGSDTRELAGGCSLYYMNMDRLAVSALIDTGLSSPGSAEESKLSSECVGLVKGYFSSMGIKDAAVGIQPILLPQTRYADD